MPDPVQRAIGFMGACLTLPLVGALCLLVRLDSPGPAIYRAQRIGRGGRLFTCHKLRTMRWAPEDGGPGITAGGDRRVTRLGSLLRRTRLDELPQLWDVARGAMRLVGPRPEDPAFVDLADPLHRIVFTATPGITGLTQLSFADEDRRLDPTDPERHYREVVLPAKLRLDEAYLRNRSTRLDLWILAQTPLAAIGRTVGPPDFLDDPALDELRAQDVPD